MFTLKTGGKLDRKRIAAMAAMLILLVAVCVLPNLVPTYIVILIASIFMYIIMSVSWSIFSGPTGYISLASAAFFGIGIYVAAILGESLPLYALMLIGGAAAFIVAFIIGAITLRLRGVYFTIFTFGLVELLKNLVLWLEIQFTHTRGRFVVSIDHQTVYYYLLGTLVLVILTTYIIKKSRFGMALSSVGESEESAAHIGINTTVVKIIAYAISAFWVGAAGAAMATRWGYIDPGIAFNSLYSFLPVLMAIFGGMRRIPGPVIGAALFAYLQETLITNYPAYYMIIIGVIMIAAIIFLPDGLIGLVQRIRGAKRRAGSHADS